jgi:hypothetical protein
VTGESFHERDVARALRAVERASGGRVRAFVVPSEVYPNEVVVTGGLWQAISARFRVAPVLSHGEATNELYVWPDFMKSRYRITVTLDPDDEQPPEASASRPGPPPVARSAGEVQQERGYSSDAYREGSDDR